MAFLYKRTLTVPHVSCGSVNSSNFPCLVSFTDATFKVAGSGGHVQNSNGYDICFFSDSVGATPLTWEMESYNSATGAVVAWVKLPTISVSVDIVFYVLYGDATISTFQSTATGVWPAQYKAVYHQASLTADSTSNANTLSNTSVTSGTGQIDGDGVFNGAAVQSLASPAGIPTRTFPIVLECWVNPTAFAAPQYLVQASLYGGTNVSIFGMALDTGGTVYIYNNTIHQTAGGALTANVWTHLLLDIQSVNTAILYINGIANTITLDGSTVANYGVPQITIGDIDTGGAPLTGALDEVRISITSPTQSWVTAQYNNHSNPNGFPTLGAEGAVLSPAAFGGGSFILWQQ